MRLNTTIIWRSNMKVLIIHIIIQHQKVPNINFKLGGILTIRFWDRKMWNSVCQPKFLIIRCEHKRAYKVWKIEIWLRRKTAPFYEIIFQMIKISDIGIAWPNLPIPNLENKVWNHQIFTKVWEIWPHQRKLKTIQYWK